MKPNKLSIGCQNEMKGPQLKRPRIRAGGLYISRGFAALSGAHLRRASSLSSVVALQNRHAAQATKETAAHIRTTFLSRFKLITATVLFCGTVSRQINLSHTVHS